MKTLMKNGVKIALAQMNVIAGNPRANATWMIAEIYKAAVRGVDIIVFPELCVPGYVIGDMPEDESFVRDVWEQNDRITNATKKLDIVAIFGSYGKDYEGAVGEDGRLRKLNVGIIVQHGMVCKNQAGLPYFVKTLMPKYRMFDDERHFLSLQKRAVESGVELKDSLQPFHLKIRGGILRIGAMVCEDMWDQDYSYKPARILAAHGVDLMLNISCSPWSWQKNRARDNVVKKLLQDIKVPFIYVNNVGPQNNGKNIMVFDGATTVYNQDGEVVHVIKPYYASVETVTVTSAMKKRVGEYTDTSDTHQLWLGVMQGCLHYLNTIPPHLRTVVVGLSGGIDSAVVAAIFVRLLGSQNVIGINMPYEGYNSKETQEIAAQIAQNLGIKYEVIPITKMVDLKAEQLGIEPGTPPFKTLQAIERMTVLAYYASMVGGIFTCNGNKTESAFGYVTLNGDGRGAIAPLGDLVKGEVYQLAHHLNTAVFEEEVIPKKAIAIDPMDELSKEGVRKDPFDYGRVGEDGTLRRGYHDEVVRAIVCFRKNPEWFLQEYQNGTLEASLMLEEGRLALLFPTAEAFVKNLEWCWGLFWSSTFKRVQSVPNILVSKRAFGWDYRESVLPPYFTDKYLALKQQLLA